MPSSEYGGKENSTRFRRAVTNRMEIQNVAQALTSLLFLTCPPLLT